MRTIGAGFDGAMALAEMYRDPKNSPSAALLVDRPLQPEPAPLGTDRLPVDWYQARSEALKERLPDVDAILLATKVNQIYFTGCFRGGDSRRSWVLLPASETNAAHWFIPRIDLALVQAVVGDQLHHLFLRPARRRRISRTKGA